MLNEMERKKGTDIVKIAIFFPLFKVENHNLTKSLHHIYAIVEYFNGFEKFTLAIFIFFNGH